MSLSYIKHQMEQGNLILKPTEAEGILSIEIEACSRNVLLTQWVVSNLSKEDKKALHNLAKAQSSE